jgi:hypothetical protein
VLLSRFDEAYFFRICLMKLGALTLGAYSLIIVVSFWCISLFISMKCHILSCWINISLKSTLSDICIAIPACFRGPLVWEIIFQPFTLSHCFCQFDGLPVNNRLLDLPFTCSLSKGVF